MADGYVRTYSMSSFFFFPSCPVSVYNITFREHISKGSLAGTGDYRLEGKDIHNCSGDLTPTLLTTFSDGARWNVMCWRRKAIVIVGYNDVKRKQSLLWNSNRILLYFSVSSSDCTSSGSMRQVLRLIRR